MAIERGHVIAMRDVSAVVDTVLSGLAVATVLVALGLAPDRFAHDHESQLARHTGFDPLWPEHLRCWMLGSAAAHDRICTMLFHLEAEG